MGEMADYYIDRMLDRHMNIGNSRSRSKKNQIEAFIQNLSDKELIFAAQTMIQDRVCNEKYLEVAKRIISSSPLSLSDKQRNCFYGLIDWQEIEVRKYLKQEELERLSDADLMSLSREAVEKNLHNANFLSTSNKILDKKPGKLSDKERNCLYGLVSNYFILK